MESFSNRKAISFFAIICYLKYSVKVNGRLKKKRRQVSHATRPPVGSLYDYWIVHLSTTPQDRERERGLSAEGGAV
uniref:Secreted protein n=1 Tax=Caenorhabditis tropicalis TaxID=1561998 RepID=A0A1I7US91_9PELO